MRNSAASYAEQVRDGFRQLERGEVSRLSMTEIKALARRIYVEQNRQGMNDAIGGDHRPASLPSRPDTDGD